MKMARGIKGGGRNDCFHSIYVRCEARETSRVQVITAEMAKIHEREQREAQRNEIVEALHSNVWQYLRCIH
jgi:hypothetical protein